MKEANKYLLIDKMKSNRVLQPIFTRIKKLGSNHLSLDTINDLNFIKDNSNSTRINLVLPTLRKTKVFGGINTALTIYRNLFNELNAEARIIILNDELDDEKWEFRVEGFSSSKEDRKIHFLAREKEVGLRRKDYFLFTSWRTFYTFSSLIDCYYDYYQNINYKVMYLIQDFEPGFYAWSTEYALAESTYRNNSNKVIGIFNSKELFCYFKDKGYSFAKELYFEPCINEKLKEILMSNCGKNITREKRILIYGRPSEYRNAFEIIRYALKIWSKTYSKSSEWEIVSLGEGFDDIQLENNRIVSKGKVSLQEYASMMLTAYAGISLMISPHPSYPPLEMSTFGIKTITNKFENKDLSYFNANLYCVSECTPDKINDLLIKICEGYSKNTCDLQVNTPYVKNDSFKDIGNKLAVALIGD